MAETKDGESLTLISRFIKEYRGRIERNNLKESPPRSDLPSFARPRPVDTDWMQENYDRFLRETPNVGLIQEAYLGEMGYITAVAYTADGEFIAVAHSTGLVQLRQSSNGRVWSTLRNIQFPPRPVYALHCYGGYCYAACTDGVVYKFKLHSILAESSSPQDQFTGKSELDGLQVQFFGETADNVKSSTFVTSRSAALCLGVSADGGRMAVGYADTSIKIYDMQTQESIYSYKVHKMRLNFTAKKLQRMHTQQVCALVCHPEQPTVFASGAWDETLRIWDTRCRVGCMMTFEGVNICANSLDLNRDFCLAGSWQPLDALSLWDLRARKRVSVINAQNRRPDVDGEYIYACQFWRSDQYNRKGKYGIVGGSGTESVDVINLHNRYIACSYPARGTVLAVASRGDSVAYGGTAPVFSVVRFHDPKHEEDAYALAKEEADGWKQMRCLELPLEIEDEADLEMTHVEEEENVSKEASVLTLRINDLQESDSGTLPHLYSKMS